jgi:hypothetical protein
VDIENRIPTGLEMENTMALSDEPLFAAYVVREGEAFIFLSPDGDEFLEVSLPRLPEMSEHEAKVMRQQVVNLLGGKTADGEPRRFTPMSYARRWFTGIIPYEEKTSDVVIFEWDGSEWITDHEVKFHGERPERLTAPEPQ